MENKIYHISITIGDPMKKITSSFWEHLAKNYPSFKDPSMKKDVQTMIARAERFGIEFKEKEILDIGCGTGTVAIPLGKKGAKVTATDISLTMLKRLESDAKEEGVSDLIQTIQSDWENFPLKRQYSIVLASMTPALFSQELINKYINASKEYGIFVGWGEYKYNNFFQDLLHAHKREYRQGKNSTKKFFKILQQENITAEITYFESSWSDTYTPLQAFHYAVQHLRREHIKPLRFNEIKKIIDKHKKNGKVTVSNKAEKGVVVWRKNLDL